MLLVVALISLFALAALASIGVIADALVKGMNAYPQLKQAAVGADERVARVRKIETIGLGNLPAARASAAVRRIPANRTGNIANRKKVSAAA